MADKWAVIAIHRDAKGRIERFRCVKLHQTGAPYGGNTDFSSHDLAASILNRNEFWTALPESHGGLKWGAPLEIALRTHPDATAADNLEKLPTF